MRKKFLSATILCFSFLLILATPRPTFAFTRIFLTSTTTTTWTVPSDWNSASNTIEVIGGGANGNSWGGGGGGYSESSNVSLTPGATVTIRVGVGGSAGFSFNSGTSTYLCNSTSNCASIAGSAVVVGANGGIATFSGPTGATTTGAVGTTHKYAGGNGGNPACCGNAGGGGGGAAGPLGAGGNGSDSVTNSTPGGGGGNGGGSSSVASTTGGNNQAGTGGAVSGNATNGGGGGAASSIGGNGGNGTEWDATHGSGGGGGGGDNTHGGNGGLYGGGAGGDGNSIGGAGGQGIIVITYVPITADIRNGLVGYWPFDGKYVSWNAAGTAGTSTDATGNGNNGTLVSMNRATSTVAGKIGQGLSFNGTSQDIKLAGFQLPSAFTMSVWAKKTGAGNEEPRAMLFSGGNNDEGTYIDICLGGHPLFSLTSSVTQYLTFSSGPCAATGIWTHYVATFDGGNTVFYINGIQVGSSSISGTIVKGSNAYIGNFGGSDYYFHGVEDDVRIYNRALTPIEVSHLYVYGQTLVNKSDVGLTDNDLNPASGFATSTSGLAAYYTFDGKYMSWPTSTSGTSTDSSGNRNNATFVGMSQTTAVVTGKAGQAIQLDGADNYVQGPVGLVGGGSTSVCAWIKQSTFASSANAIVANSKFIFFTTPTNNTLGLTSDASTNALAATNSIVNGVWEFVCGTRTGAGTTNLYVNGLLSGTANQTSGTPSTSTFNTNIGAKGNGIINFFGGDIDDVRIYNKILTPTEITQLYRETGGDIVNKSPTGITNTDLTSASSTTGGNPSGLVAYWPFDGKYVSWNAAGTAGTSTDASGNGNNGTLNNMSRSTSPVVGKMGQALKFSGATQYVRFGSLPVSSTNATYAAWVKMISYQSGIYPAIVQNEVSSSHPQGLFEENGTGIVLLEGGGPDTGDAKRIIPASSIPVGTWHFIVGTISGTTYTMYLDGVSSGSSYSDQNYADVGVSAIGRGNGNYVKAIIDDVRIYNRALSPTEVKQLYNTSK